MRHFLPRAVAAMLAAAAAWPALAQQPPDPTRAEPDAALKRLPAGSADLRFTGEFASREWAVFFNERDAAQARRFSLAFTNAISVEPDSSRISVMINGLQVATAMIDAGPTSKTVSAAVPPGLLSPGYNSVRVTVDERHRVDCSVPGTFELWTSLDPLATGFAGPDALPAAHAVPADLLAVAPAQDGTTPIRIRLEPGAAPADLAHGLEAAQSVIVAARIEKPRITFAANPGEGPGLDLVPGDHDPITITRDASGRTVLTLPATEAAGTIAAALDDALNPSARRGSPLGLRAAAWRGGRPVKAGDAVPLLDPGLGDVAFTGRRLVLALAFAMPATFAAGDYGSATVSLDADVLPNLDPESALLVRVNGRDAGFLAIPPSASTLHERVRIPLRMFRAGTNMVEIEARTPAAPDKACDPAAVHPVRIRLNGSSSIRFDDLLEAAVLPDMSTITGGGYAAPSSGSLALVTTLQDLDAAATVVAGMAAQSQAVIPVSVHLGPSLDANASTLVVAASDQLAPGLVARVAAVPGARAWLGFLTGARPARKRTGGLMPLAGRLLSRAGFVPAGPDEDLALSERDLLAVMLSGPGRESAAGGDAVHLVLTASSHERLNRGVAALAAGPGISALTGEVSAYDIGSGTLRSMAPRAPVIVLARIRSIRQARLALAGLFSNHPLAYVGLVTAACLLLGASTHRLIRRSGVQA